VILLKNKNSGSKMYNFKAIIFLIYKKRIF